MPLQIPDATGNEETVSVTGHGVFGFDPIVRTPGTGSCHNSGPNVNYVYALNDPDELAGDYVLWRPGTELHIFSGNVRVRCKCDLVGGIQYRGNDCDGTAEWRWWATGKLIVTRDPGGEQVFEESWGSDWAARHILCCHDPVSGNNEPYEIDFYDLWWDVSPGSFDWAETHKLRQYQDYDNDSFYETRDCLASTVDATIQFNFWVTQRRQTLTDTGPGPPLPPPPPTPPTAPAIGDGVGTTWTPPIAGAYTPAEVTPITPGGPPDPGDPLPPPPPGIFVDCTYTLPWVSVCVSENSQSHTINGVATYTDPGEHTVGPVTGYDFGGRIYRGGLHIALTGDCAYGSGRLGSTYGSWSAVDGLVTAGGADGTCSITWAGGDSDWHGPYGLHANWNHAPSWAAKFKYNCYKWKDGSAYPTTTRIWQQMALEFGEDGPLEAYQTVVGEFDTNDGSFHRYPASGEGHYIDASVWRGAIPVPPFSSNAYVQLFERLFWLKREDYSATPISKPDLRGANGRLSLAPKVDWCHTNGIYLDSLHWIGNTLTTPNHTILHSRYTPNTLPLHLVLPFNAGTLNIASEHTFAAIGNWTNWFIQSWGSFYSWNPSYHIDGAVISLDGSAVKIEVTNAPVVVSITPNANAAYIGQPALKHFAYRWLRLHWKADAAGKRWRFGLDRLLCAGFPWFPYYGWEMTAGADDTYQDDELDLARPPYRSHGSCQTVGWDAFGGLVHPADYYPNGAAVWAIFLDNGTYHVASGKGFHKTGGTHQPLLLVQPLDAKDPMPGFEVWEDHVDGSSSAGWWWAKFLTNGVRGAHWPVGTSNLAPLSDPWITLLAQLGASDTGVVVTPSTSRLMKCHAWFGHELTRSKATQPFARPLTPGSDEIIKGQPVAWGTFGHYGMGRTHYGGSYSRDVEFEGDWVWEGALAGNVINAGDVLEVRDNDTATALATVTSDDDGYYQADVKYGVADPFADSQWLEGYIGPQYPPRIRAPDSKEYSGFLPPYSYTTLGKRLNSHWLHSTDLTNPVDGSDYLLELSQHYRYPVVVMDRMLTWQDWYGVPPAAGLDLARGAYAWHRVDMVDGRVVHQCSVDECRSWGPVQIFDDAGSDAFPTVCVDNMDFVYVWYHDVAGAARCWRGNALGRPDAWDDLLTVSGRKFPRGRLGVDGWQYVAWHDGSQLRVSRGRDRFTTISASPGDGGLEDVAGMAFSATAQPPGLVVDRHGGLHLGYESSGDYYQRRATLERLGWEGSPTLLATGLTQCTLTFGPTMLVFAGWDATGRLYLGRTDPQFVDTQGTPVPFMPATFPTARVGLVEDREGRWRLLAGIGDNKVRAFSAGDLPGPWTEIPQPPV